MKGMKFLHLVSTWLMRLGIAHYAYTGFWKNFIAFETKSLFFYIALAHLLFALLLIIGGFMKNQVLTIVSGLVLFLASGYLAFIGYAGGLEHGYSLYILTGGIGFYFLANGNK